MGNYFCSDVNYYPYIYYASDPTGTWTYKQVDSKKQYMSGIEYCNGKFVLTTYDSNYYPSIYYATNPGDTWTQKQMASVYSYIKGVAYHNGMWAIAGRSSDGKTVYVYTATDIAGNWTQHTVVTLSSTSDVIGTFYFIDKWTVIVNTTYDTDAYMTSDVTGAWTDYNIVHAGTIALLTGAKGNANISCVAVNDNSDVMAFGGSTSDSAFSMFTRFFAKFLPLVSLSAAYAYIKALK